MTPTDADRPDLPPPSGAWKEALFHRLTQACGVFVLLTLGGIVAVTLDQSLPALSRAGEFRLFTSTEWRLTSSSEGTVTFGMLAYVWGTVVTSALSMLIAVPLGVATAAYLAEIASPRVRRVGAFLVELLAAIPSVVYGFWGVFFLVPRLQSFFAELGAGSTGKGILATSITLAIMILPYITAISFDACRSVPQSQRQGSLALGATRWQMIWTVVLPYARPGIIAACFLALGRALGETMAVTMLIGNTPIIDFSIAAKGNTIPSAIAVQLPSADDARHMSALIAMALILLVITAAMNLTARGLLRRMSAPRVRAGKGVRVETGVSPSDPPVITAADCAAHSGSALRRNVVMSAVLRLAFWVAVVPLFLILGFILFNGAQGLNATFFTTDARISDPLKAGLGHAMIGSVILVAMATVVAVPIGILAAIYLAESRNSRLADAIRFAAELLTGVPSIVIGVFIYVLLVRSGVFGQSGYAGACALVVMMVPVIIRSAEESLRVVPDSLRQASYALGASRVQTVFRVIVPAAIPAIVTGVFLAIGRIAGETAPLLFTAGNASGFTTNPSERMPFLPYYIYDYTISPRGNLDQQALWQQQAWAGAFVLLSVVMILNVGIRVLAGNRMIAASRAD
jgi:phosphate transport system permease protein